MAVSRPRQPTHFPAGSLTADKTLDYILDPAGRRVAVKKDGAFIAGYLYDGALRVIGKTDGNGRLREQYVYGTLGHSPDFAVMWDEDGAYLGAYLFAHDQLGSVVETWQVRGFGSALLQKATTSRVDFGPWGEPEVLTAEVSGGPDHPFGYAGGLWERDTGLVRFGAREYDPELGRWLSRDPIGFAGGWNQFGYVAGDPVNYADPRGLLRDGTPQKPDSPQAAAAEHQAEILGFAAGAVAWLAVYGILEASAFEAAASGSEVLYARTLPPAAALLAGTAARIGQTCEVGERYLEDKFGGVPQKSFPTQLGHRFVDNFLNLAAHEAKVGYTSLSSRIAQQIAKDVDLLESGAAEIVQWHFFTSPVTGLGGPSGPLAERLLQAGMDIVTHF